MKVRCALVLLMSVFSLSTMRAQGKPAAPAAVAATPPMGWNSWDAYGLTITEDQFRANALVLRNELAVAGWNYAVIDEGWFMQNPQDRPHPEKLVYTIDANGRYVPVPARFPSAGKAAPQQAPGNSASNKMLMSTEATSFKPLADWVHEQHLKFGIHIVRGIPRASVERNLPIAGSSFHVQDAADTTDACPWDPTNWGVKNNEAGQAWYDSLMAQYAEWGVDLLKVDCISDHPYKADEIRMIRKAIDKTGRPIVLSLSPGPTALSHADEVAALSNMWRIADDFWDVWKTDKKWPTSVVAQFANVAAWAQYAGPGHWPDADMLPLSQLGPEPGWGKPRTTALTPDEQKTVLTLWAMARSPLIVGANLTQLDDPTYKMLINKDVISVDQTATRSGEMLHSGDIIAWTADLPPDPANDAPKGSIALALFNVGESLQVINSSFETFNIDDGTYRVKDAWTGKNVGKLKSVTNLTVQPHACVLWLLKK